MAILRMRILYLADYFKADLLSAMDDGLQAAGNSNVHGAFGIVPPSLSFATTDMHRTHRFPGLLRKHYSEQRRDASKTCISKTSGV